MSQSIAQQASAQSTVCLRNAVTVEKQAEVVQKLRPSKARKHTTRNGGWRVSIIVRLDVAAIVAWLVLLFLTG